MTPLRIAVQWLLKRLGTPGWGLIAVIYYRSLCAVLRIRVHVVGNSVRDRTVLFISIHVSWADIVAIGSIVPIAYVSKSEIAKWRLVGIAAKSQRMVFVDRSWRQQTGDAISEIVDRLASSTSVVLFAEGTSSDGNRVLSFRSALVGTVKEASARYRHPANVNLLYEAQRYSDGPPASPDGGVVWRSRLHASHQGVHRTRRRRRRGQLPGAGGGRPQSHDQIAGRRGPPDHLLDLARPLAPGAGDLNGATS